MFQAIGNIFGKVLGFDICHCVQKREEKLEDEKVEVIENGRSQNGEVHEGKDKDDVNQKVGNRNSFICCSRAPCICNSSCERIPNCFNVSLNQDSCGLTVLYHWFLFPDSHSSLGFL